ncbi:MAG: FkbM family methyltransferase [Pyrinomonadaceae bacterium]|nr:FkbM family methyltransferase [Pyrinomonadaceae bacterium]
MDQKIQNKDVSKHQKLIFKGLEYFRKLKAKYVDVSLKETDEGILVGFNDLTFHLKTLEDFHILTEVFYDGDYDLKTTDECVVFDVGMNIGLASLFFARKDFVKKIYSYEPVPETFEQGQYNFALNQKYSHKIHSFNFGLGSENKMETFYFHPEAKGNCGSRGLKSPSLKNLDNLIPISVEIREICRELQPLLESDKNYKKFIKLDCEGGEYEILTKLDEGNCLKFFEGVIIEWHDLGSEILENILLKNGFLIISRFITPISGLIYAFKLNK